MVLENETKNPGGDQGIRPMEDPRGLKKCFDFVCTSPGMEHRIYENTGFMKMIRHGR